MTRPPLDPDPLHVDEIVVPFVDAAVWVAGYDAGWAECERRRPPFLQTTAFGLGVVAGIFLAVVLTYAAASR